MNCLSDMSRTAIARWAYQAAIAHHRISFGYSQATSWDQLDAGRSVAMTQVVGRIEHCLLHGEPVTTEHIALAWGNRQVFEAVAEAAIKMEIGWRPTKPGQRSNWACLFEAVELALLQLRERASQVIAAETVGEAMGRVTIQVNAAVWEAANAGNRVVLSGEAVGITLHGIYSVVLPGADIRVEPDADLLGNCVVAVWKASRKVQLRAVQAIPDRAAPPDPRVPAGDTAPGLGYLSRGSSAVK
jgi:hypothetical protein